MATVDRVKLLKQQIEIIKQENESLAKLAQKIEHWENEARRAVEKVAISTCDVKVRTPEPQIPPPPRTLPQESPQPPDELPFRLQVAHVHPPSNAHFQIPSPYGAINTSESVRKLFVCRPDVFDAFLHPTKYPWNYVMVVDNAKNMCTPITPSIVNSLKLKHNIDFIQSRDTGLPLQGIYRQVVMNGKPVEYVIPGPQNQTGLPQVQTNEEPQPKPQPEQSHPVEPDTIVISDSESEDEMIKRKPEVVEVSSSDTE